jgi:NitT/TauT family transport system substrate-binding protein
MKNFKKLWAVLLACMMIFVVGCGSSASDNGVTVSETSSENVTQEAKHFDEKVQIAALKGPTAIGMVQLMQNAKENTAGADYEFTIAATADEFTANLIKGDINIAALPCNAAATLYNKSNGKIKILGINTLGVLYVLDTGSSVQSVADLKGRTIYTTGKGTTPEYTLRYLLQSAGINPDTDVTIEFESEAAEVAAIIAKETAAGQEVVAMLPQPYVTTVMMNNENVRIALDVTQEWEKLNGQDSTVVTGVVVVNTEYYNTHKELVDSFMQEYEKSAAYVNENVDAAAQLVEDFDIFKAAVAKKAIPYCNITFVTGSEMKTKVTNYLNVLYQANPDSIGGKMPGDDFYIQ